ncbi:MAG: HAD-IA family hydrolase [Planctomycetes bacterium]|nr:HAD-IA family hydrolase [Planctomycetota bacterium]
MTVLLLDVMDTLVVDPFRGLPALLGVSWEALLAEKDPDAWPAFERGELDEAGYARRFFRDRRPVDGAAVRAYMAASYRWVDGAEALLARLAARGVEMHALSNYPCWYELVEAAVGLSRYVPWTFVSCRTGVRKPDPEAYLGAARALGRAPGACLFVDDRPRNVAAAEAVGMPALRFTSTADLAAALEARGVLSGR